MENHKDIFHQFWVSFSVILTEPNPCRICGLEMASQEDGEEHFYWHHHCWSCGVFFPFASLLLGHLSENHPELYCEICGMTFDNPGDRKPHQDNDHYPCEKCRIFLGTLENLRNHWMTSESHQQEFCRDCDLFFEDSDAWGQHMENLHLLCLMCGQTFPEKRLLDEHMENLHIVCVTCRQIFREKRLLDEHNVEYHPEQQPKPTAMPEEGNPKLGHYEMLGIDPSSSHEEVLRLVRLQRIACHPDQLLKQEGLSAEYIERIQTRAKQVGQAADILSDPKSRAAYDSERVFRV